MQTRHFLTNRQNITDSQIAEYDEDLTLGDGEVLVEPQYFALTANNVTYGAAGEFLGYFKFFPVTEQALAQKGMVHVPVWAMAKVTESRCDDLAVGSQFYGFLPMASHLKLTPGRVSTLGFRDEATHRKELPAVYNQYLLTGDDDTAGQWRCLLNPLFATSWLLWDYLEAHDYFDAKQIIVSSASSKTSFGLLRMLASESKRDITVTGLTSNGNKAFVEAMGCCDKVVTYDRVATDLTQESSVYIDLAGDTDLRAALHEHLADVLTHSCAVGTSHWESFKPDVPAHGPKPVFFFAPSHVKMRRNEWGPGVIEGKLEEGWQQLARWAQNHLSLESHQGFDQIGPVWQAVLDGSSDAKTGQIIRLA